MSTDRTLARIDDTLDDWDQWDGHSPDAARWAGGERIDDVSIQADITPFIETLTQRTIDMAEAYFFLAGAGLDEKLARLWCDMHQRPHSAAERTRSPRRRAGSRRTKRQARRRHG